MQWEHSRISKVQERSYLFLPCFITGFFHRGWVSWWPYLHQRYWTQPLWQQMQKLSWKEWKPSWRSAQQPIKRSFLNWFDGADRKCYILPAFWRSARYFLFAHMTKPFKVITISSMEKKTHIVLAGIIVILILFFWIAEDSSRAWMEQSLTEVTMNWRSSCYYH